MSNRASIPSATANPVDHADWIELEVLASISGSTSFQAIARNILISGSTEANAEDEEDFVDSSGDQSEIIADDAWREIEKRQEACGGGE